MIQKLCQDENIGDDLTKLHKMYVYFLRSPLSWIKWMRFYFLYLLKPQGLQLSGFAQKVGKDAPKRGGEKVSPLLELLPPFAERTLYHGYISCSLWRLGLRSRPRRKRPRTARPLSCVIRGQWTTAESYSLRFNLNARVLKSIPAKKGNFTGEFFPPEPYLCPLSGRNQKVGALRPE